jgi:hypothetical protein
LCSIWAHSIGSFGRERGLFILQEDFQGHGIGRVFGANVVRGVHEVDYAENETEGTNVCHLIMSTFVFFYWFLFHVVCFMFRFFVAPSSDFGFR